MAGSLVLGMTACGTTVLADDADRDLTIGFTANSLENDTVQEFLEDIREKCDEENWDLTTVDYRSDLSICIDTLENFITAGVDVIMVQVPNAEGLKDVIERAQEAGIIVVCYDTTADIGDYRLSQSDEEIGKCIGESAAAYVNEHFDGEAVAVSVGLPSNEILKVREESAVEAFLANCNGTVVDSIACENYQGDWAAIAEVIVQSNPETQIILDIADVVNVSIAEGYSALGYSNSKDGIAMFGCDCIGEVLDSWREGGDYMIKGSVYTYLPESIYEAFTRATETALTGERFEKVIEQKIVAVSPDNFTEIFGE